MHVASLSASTPNAARAATSHFTTVAARRIVKDRRKEISPGLLSAMLYQLGLHRDDVR